MAVIGTLNEAVTGATITASDYNDNMDAIKTAVNNIDNTQIDDDADIAESKIAFDTATGHKHDGSDSMLLELAALNSVRGQIIFKAGSTGIIAGLSDSGTITFSGEAFSRKPLIMAYIVLSGTNNTIGIGGGLTTESGSASWTIQDGYYIYNITTTGFNIYNANSNGYAFDWVAIGI